jgi:hypothetical protein
MVGTESMPAQLTTNRHFTDNAALFFSDLSAKTAQQVTARELTFEVGSSRTATRWSAIYILEGVLCVSHIRVKFKDT